MKTKTKQHPYTAQMLNPMNCICCDKEINLLHPDDEPREDSEPSSEMWNGGVINEIAAGYGSNVDGDVYLIAICDECIEQKRNDGSIVFLHNYMGFDSEKLRNEYNTQLHRKIKLNRIVE